MNVKLKVFNVSKKNVLVLFSYQHEKRIGRFGISQNDLASQIGHSAMESRKMES